MTLLAPYPPQLLRGELEYVFLRPEPDLTEHELQRAMGLAGRRPLRPALQRQLLTMVRDELPLAQPRMVLGIGSVRTVLDSLPPYATVARYLESADRAVLMAGAAGLPPPVNGGDPADPLLTYVRNAVAVALVRKLFVWSRQYLKDRWPEWDAGEPITPGNCGVPLNLQPAFLEHLPIAAVDIRYDSLREMLVPLAAICGLIGVGRYPVLQDNPCVRCPSPDCPLRESDFNPQKFRDLTWYCSKGV